MRELHLLINDDGHWFIDDVLGVQVGSMEKRADGTWIVHVNRTPLEAPDFEAAKRLFVEKYDFALIKMGPGSGDLDDGLESPYEWIDDRDGAFFVIGPDEVEHSCESEIEAINLVKRLHEGPFSYLGLNGEDGSNGVQIVDLTPLKKMFERRK